MTGWLAWGIRKARLTMARQLPSELPAVERQVGEDTPSERGDQRGWRASTSACIVANSAGNQEP